MKFCFIILSTVNLPTFLEHSGKNVIKLKKRTHILIEMNSGGVKCGIVLIKRQNILFLITD